MVCMISLFIYRLDSSISTSVLFLIGKSSGNWTFAISSRVSGIFSLVMSGNAVIKKADKSVTIAANILTIKEECNISNSPSIIPVIAPILAPPEQIPVSVVLKWKIHRFNFCLFIKFPYTVIGTKTFYTFIQSIGGSKEQVNIFFPLGWGVYENFIFGPQEFV